MKVSLNTNNNISFQGIYNNKQVLKGLKFAAEHTALFTATVSLGFSAIRPAVILATPKTDENNKKIASAKSLSSAGVGFLITAAATTPLASAVKKIDKNPKKFLSTSSIKNLQNGAKTLLESKSYMLATQLFKLGLGLLIAVPKSALTALFIPPIMKFFFPEKKHRKIEIPKHQKQNSSIISFKGLYNQATNTLAKGIGKVINSSTIQNFAKKYADTNFIQHIMSITDTILTLSFIHQLKINKNIEEKRKKPLIHNSIMSTGMCIMGGYALNDILNKPTERFINKFKEVNKNLPELEKYVQGIRIAKPALILGTIYYVFIPVLSTFFADRTGKS